LTFKAALIEALNLILDRYDDPIVDVTYLNPFSIAEVRTEKVIVMDIKTETSSGELIDIEMQMGNLDNYVNRTIFYGSKQLTKSLASGDDYAKMKKSIVISFIATTLFPLDVPMHSKYTLHECTTGKELSGLLELHYIELGKIDIQNSDACAMSPLEQFGAYIKYSGDKSKSDFLETLVQKGEKVISMTDTVLRKISEEERLQQLREDREIAEFFHLMDKTTAREQGQMESALKIAKNFKNDGIPVAVIAKNTGLTEAEIEKL